jgi:serine/threonine protein kinase
MSLSAGTMLGPYRVARLVGAGGMGEVYEAVDTRLDRTVAIKVLPAHFASDPERRKRFEREARAVSSLNHPHIATLYDVGDHDGTYFLVMELVQGRTLDAVLHRGKLPTAQALTYATQIAGALDAAHRGGVVHREL